MGQQIIDDFPVGVHIFSCGCPADDAKFVIVAFANGIATALDQETNDREQLLLSGKVQRIGIIPLASNVRIGAAVEEKFHPSFAFPKNRVMHPVLTPGPAISLIRPGSAASSASSRARSPRPAASCKDLTVASMDPLACREDT